MQNYESISSVYQLKFVTLLKANWWWMEIYFGTGIYSAEIGFRLGNKHVTYEEINQNISI